MSTKEGWGISTLRLGKLVVVRGRRKDTSHVQIHEVCKHWQSVIEVKGESMEWGRDAYGETGSQPLEVGPVRTSLMVVLTQE